MDGFRALAHSIKTACVWYPGAGTSTVAFLECALPSAMNSSVKPFSTGRSSVWIVEGRSQFYELLRRRGQPVLYVFDLLWPDGEDLRERQLIERKRLLRSIVPEQSSSLLYADHIEQHGVEFFRLACERDLEGVVAKWRYGGYGQSWFKIRNPNYSQYAGRHELFETRNAATAR
jgi:bifunctional non-homologous end joining protein LigD